MLCIRRSPPSPWALQALLDDVAVGTFDFSRANREVAHQSAVVVELFVPMAQVALALPHGRLAVLYLRCFKMRL